MHAKDIYVCLREERHVSLAELIDANRKNTMMGKGWQPVGRSLFEETHHCTFIAAICTLRPASVPIIRTTFNTVVLASIATISVMLSKPW